MKVEGVQWIAGYKLTHSLVCDKFKVVLEEFDGVCRMKGRGRVIQAVRLWPRKVPSRMEQQ